MQLVLGFILFGTFALTAAIAERDPQSETKRITGKRRKSRRRQ
jgi:hypothetical protein